MNGELIFAVFYGIPIFISGLVIYKIVKNEYKKELKEQIEKW